MLRLEYTPMALEDLQHIHEYIIANWGENTAKRILKKMSTNIRRLEEYPLSGVDLGKIIDVPTDYRYLYTEKNYVFYHLEVDKIRVIRVLNEQQNYVQQLFGISSEPDDDYWNGNE